jgi:methionyl-tRNA formyltransferase
MGQADRPRVIFMGTPEFAVPALERLAAKGSVDVALVVTQPDRPAGRGRKLVSPAVKEAADRLGLPVLQTPTLRDPDVRARIVKLAPDLIVVAAFGMILGKWILTLPRRGCVNLHASLLPKYRGANPIATAIADGEAITGVSLMHMEAGLDTGAVYATVEVDITDEDTTESLTSRLADAAGELLVAHLAALIDGSLPAVPQGAGATLTRPMMKADGWLDFGRSAAELERRVRAVWPWPRAWTTGPGGSRIQIHAAGVHGGLAGEPGRIVRRGRDVLIATVDGALALRRIQLPGGTPIEGAAILQARGLAEGAVLGTVDGPEDVPPLVVPVTEPSR